MTAPAIPGWICEQELGHGADATVWRARPADSGEAVALKVIPLARLRDPAAHLREAWAAGSTGSRQVVAVHDTGQHGDVAWLAMELAAGDAAGLAAGSGGRLAISEAARIARDTARGLQALADHGFVHRDVKPSNILLRSDGSAMIGDLAPLRGGGTATRSAELSGTPAYLSPEQIRGSAPDQRSDVHALGATLFALIAGRPPFAADSALDLLRAIVEDPAPDLRRLVPDVPPAIAAVIATALAKDPVQRQQRPAQFAAELDEALVGRVPARVAAPTAPPPAPVVLPAWLPWAAAGVAALLGVVLGVVSARPSAEAVAAEATAAEVAAVARRERTATEARTETLARLHTRLDQLRREHDRLTARQAPAPATSPLPPAAENTASVVPAPVPAPAAPAAPIAPAVPAAPPPVVTAVQSAATPPAPAALPATRDPPPLDPEPAGSLPRIHTSQIAKAIGLVGFSVNPLAVRQLVAWDRSQRIWSSNDHGATWSQSDPPPSPPATTWVSSTEPPRLAQWHGANGFIPGVDGRAGWLSRDGGQTWVDVPPPQSVITLAPVEWPAQRALTADGTIHAAARVVGQRRAWRVCSTRDAGATWRDLVDVQADKLALHAAGDRLLLAAGSGTWQASLDLGQTWQDLLIGSHEHAVSSSDAASLRLLTWRGGMAVLELTSRHWSVAALAQPEGGDMSAFAIDPRDPRCAFAIDPRSGLLRTTDQGQTWRPCALTLAGPPQSLLIVGTRRPRLYCCSGNSILSIDLTTPCADLFPAPPNAPTGSLRLTSPQERFTHGGFAGAPDGTALAWYGDDTWLSTDGAVTWKLLPRHGMPYANASTRATFTRGTAVLTPGTANGIGARIGADGHGCQVPAPPGTLVRAGPAMTAAGSLVVAVAPKNEASRALSVRESLDDGATWRETGTLPSDTAVLVPVAGEVAAVYAANQDFIATCDGGRTLVPAGATGVDGLLARTWSSDGERLWVVDRRWSTLGCFDGRTRRWRTQPLGALATWADQVDWQALAVDPDDPLRLWVVAARGGLVHSRDGGRSWHWLGLPFQARATPSLALLRGAAPQLLVSVDNGIQVIDASPAAAALFNRPLAPRP